MNPDLLDHPHTHRTAPSIPPHFLPHDPHCRNLSQSHAVLHTTLSLPSKYQEDKMQHRQKEQVRGEQQWESKWYNVCKWVK
ncbi:hypothetical protein B0T21DRAFT_78386 [Apiosordaria backusii]|uniref:Uncharacterized protein n=1 Tax=Apiosordaria backusii TaxID=314023 RepID=A0AA40A778_9PEZI|nr:hypothetical protein B0T21DRAFT_78386 [Apiosordaria backusii]